jgi:hypothetical protein
MNPRIQGPPSGGLFVWARPSYCYVRSSEFDRRRRIKRQKLVELFELILPAGEIGNLNLPAGHIEHACLRNRDHRAGPMRLDSLAVFRCMDGESHFLKGGMQWLQAPSFPTFDAAQFFHLR